MTTLPMTAVRFYAAPSIAPHNPRGARAGAAVFVALYRLVAGLADRIARVGAASNPHNELADVQAVRDLALRHQASDPGFAADLLAAADRHEALHGVS